MTYEEALFYVHSLKRFGAKPGLSRMRLLMERLGDPQTHLSFLHIAGTNGKGSCTVMTSAALQAGGYRTGTYISPYVVDFRERFQINGEWIGKDAFVRLVQKVQKEVFALEEQGLLITEFEFNTALAFCWFYEEKCDIVALEVGLGGRFDATNVIPRPLVSVIMAIGLDHTAVLGDTLEKIAFEKAGIIKGGTTILYPIQAPEAAAVFFEKCAETGSTLIFPNARAVTILSSDPKGSDFLWNGEEYRVSLTGMHQVYNAVTVLEVLRVISGRFPVSLRDIKKALAEVRFPARFETLRKDPLTILDGAHNPQGTEVLRDALQLLPQRPKIGVIGMLADKDWQHAAKTLAGCFDAVITLKVDNPRTAEPEALAEVARSVCQDARVASSPAKAWEEAKKLAGSGGAVCIAGSLYLAGEMRPVVQAD